jgi:hypothetical protein
VYESETVRLGDDVREPVPHALIEREADDVGEPLLLGVPVAAALGVISDVPGKDRQFVALVLYEADIETETVGEPLAMLADCVGDIVCEPCLFFQKSRTRSLDTFELSKVFCGTYTVAKVLSHVV